MHSFLELKTPKDSVVTSLNNKTAYLLYQHISKSSTIANSKSGSLFFNPEQALGIKIDSWADIVYPMKRLIEDRLILHLFYVSYVNRKELKIQSCFIACPIEKSESIETIYNNIINISVQNILLQIENDPKFNINEFKGELATNLKKNLALSPENYPKSFIKIFPPIESSIHLLPLNERVKETVIEEIEEELILQNKIVKLENGLYFPLATTEIVEKFNAADEFIKTEMAPLYYSVAGKEMESITKQEEIYNMEPFQEPLTSLKKERAEILHNVIAPHHSENYPGELAIMTVLLFEKFVLENLIHKEETLIKEEVDRYKAKFLEHSSSWKDTLHFINEETINSIHPKVWERLQADISLTYASWCIEKEEIYVFAPRKVSAFLNCIRDMNVQMPDPTWKILAFKNLLEANEQYLHGLFSNEDTVKLYGNLLRKAYIDYFPWYYPLFIFFKFFREIFYKSAKKNIQSQQMELEFRIRTRKKEAEKERIIKYKKIAEEKIIEARRKEIIDCMDTCYFKENIIPSKQILLQKCRTQSIETIDSILKKFLFQIFTLPGEEKNEKYGVLYPLDHEWRGRESRLKKMLSKKIEELGTNSPENKRKSIPYRLVLNHILSNNKIRYKPPEETEEDKSKMRF